MKSLNYIISLFLVILIVIIIYSSIPLFLKIKGETFLYSNSAKEILTILPSQNFYYSGEDETLSFICFNYKLTNPAYPEIEFIYETKEEGKNIANKPSMVIVYWRDRILYTGGYTFIPCENSQQGFHLDFPEVFLLDTKYFKDYDSVSQFLIKVKTNIYLLQQKLKYSLYETGKERYLLFDKDLPSSYKRYLFHSLKISDNYVSN